MGTSWQIIPELTGFTNPDFLDLYAHHPVRARLDSIRKEFAIEPVQEIWAVTTRGSRIDRAIDKLHDWYGLLPAAGRPVLRIWQVKGADDLASEAECNQMAECIWRVVCKARQHKNKGRLFISLTGGRKTISSDIQNAAAFFGCDALLHVIDRYEKSSQTSNWQVERFTRPLPADIEDAFTPLITGKYDPDPLLELHQDEKPDIDSGRFFIEMPEHGTALPVGIPDHHRLINAVEKKTRQAAFLYCNYTSNLLKGDRATNFMALYRLPPAMIEKLRRTRIGIDPAKRELELAWLKKLPKAELHCHLGGVADIDEVIEIAQAGRDLVDRYKNEIKPWIAKSQRKVEEWENTGRIEDFCFKDLRNNVPGVPVPVCTAAFVLLFEDRPELLEKIVFRDCMDEARYVGIEFDAYEAMGDLQGSGLLQTEPGIRAACRILLENARKHHVTCLELRCSPVNYTLGGLSAAAVARIIDSELAKARDMECALIFTASRHGLMSKVHEHIELASELMGNDGHGFPRFRGFDLAGNEKAGSAADMRQAFMPMMEKCMHFTIHAGESDDVSSIWKAVYHLNAERIGHGLTLIHNPDLIEKFRDRSIALEMCPSSNCQIVGFKDSYLPSTADFQEYPLKKYLKMGLRVTVNTDNPGISRTNFTNELHRAARLTPGGLNLWEILLLIRNGFKASFADSAKRQELILNAEEKILGLITEGIIDNYEL